MIKRSPSLTDQVKAHIKQQILASAYEGDRIPSETDLASELGVSRTTIRDALSRLENEGVVYRKQGAGTFVNRPGLRIRSRLEEIWSYESVLKAHGYEPSVRVLDIRVESIGEEAAAGLQIEPGDEVIVIEKLFMEDKEPVILTNNQIPTVLVDGAFTSRDAMAPIFEFVSRFANRHLSYYISEIVPVTATNSLAQQLRIAEGNALIAFDEIGYDENNDPILRACSYFRDDLLRFRLIRRRA